MNKKLIFGVIFGVFAVIALLSAGKMYENIDAGEIVVIQDPFDGELHVYKTPAMVWQGWGKATHYKKSNTFWFSAPNQGDKGDAADRSIAVKWNDGGHANISGSIRYDLPTDDKQIIALHSTFGSQEAIENTIIKTNIEKAVYLTGPLMTSKESYAERRNDLIFYIEDQASKGVYKTRQVEAKEIDPITNVEKTTTKVEIMSDSTGIRRQEASPVGSSGIKLYNISINSITYDKNVEQQIATQQQAIMQVQTAIANSKRAEQEALTTAKQGEADAAKAKWEQEVIKATNVTEAEAARDVAKLAVQTAELNKQKLILEGEGEASKKRLVMQANGALEQKLAAWLEERKYAWDAFGKFTGNIVPLYQTGGSGSNGSATDWMQIMGMKAMKDLGLDMKNKE